MAKMTSTSKLTTAIVGVILVFYLIANTFNDAGSEVEGINESIKGGSIMKLLPLFLAFGVVIAVYQMTKG